MINADRLPRRSTLSFGETKVITTRLVSGEEQLLAPAPADGWVCLHAVATGRVRMTIPGDLAPQIVDTGSAVLSAAQQHAAARAETESVIHTVVALTNFTNAGETAPLARMIGRDDTTLLDPVLAFIGYSASIPIDEATSFGVYYLERLLQEMLLALRVDAVRGIELPQTAAAFSRAMTVVSAQFADPSLSAQSIAAHTRVSVRQLERVFRSNGTTIMGEVRKARLTHATDLLRDDRYAQLPIGRIANAAGFSNGSSLARALRGAGYETPKKVRHESATSPERVGT